MAGKKIFVKEVRRMAGKKIWVSVYADEEDILGKIAELEDLGRKLRDTTKDLSLFISAKSTAESD